MGVKLLADGDAAGPSRAFAEAVAADVAELRANYPGIANDGDAFTIWALKFLHGLDDDEAFIAQEPLRDGPGDGGLDAIVSDDLAQVIYLYQMKYTPNLDGVYGADAASEVFEALDLLLDEDYAAKAGPKFRAAGESLRAALDGDSEIVLRLVVAGRLSDEGWARAEAYLKSHDDDRLRFEPMDAPALYQMEVDQQSGEDLAGIEVTLRSVGDLLHLPAEAPGLDAAFVVVLDAASLITAVDKYRSRLVDRNLRFLLKTSRINDAIADSIKDPTGGKPRYFSLLNNGLTITCDAYREEDSAVVLENPQIVNGGQTTMVLWHNASVIAPDSVQVVARVIATIGESGADLAKEIAESTNRQNPIRPADLKANDGIQKRIQTDFALLTPPWFYERRRNERATLPEARRAQIERRIVTKEEIGQRWRAFDGRPASAVTAKQRMFELQDLYGATFADSIDVRCYLLAHQLFAYYHAFLEVRHDELRKRVLPQMTETDRAELIRARNQWAAHCTAASGYIIRKESGEAFAPASAMELVEALKDELRRAEGVFYPLVKLVLISAYKWFAGRRALAVASGETFVVKAELEKPDTFAAWVVEVDGNRALLGGSLGIAG